MKCYCTKKGFKSYPLMLKSYWQLLHLFYVLCLFYRLVPVSCTLMLHCSSTTTRYLLLWRSIVLKAGYFKGFWWKNEDFLLLSLTWIFTIVFCSLLLSFSLDFLSCAIHMCKYLQERGPKEWLADFFSDVQHLKHLERRKASPWNCCSADQDWSYRLALRDGLPG